MSEKRESEILLSEINKNLNLEISPADKLKKLKTLFEKEEEKEQVEKVVAGVKEIITDGNDPEMRSLIARLVDIRTRISGPYLDILPVFTSAAVVGILGGGYYLIYNQFTMGLTVVAVFLFFILYSAADKLWNWYLTRGEEKILEEIGKYRKNEHLKLLDAPDKEKDMFRNLVRINSEHIDNYYRQTRIQSNKSFSVSLICALVAFGIIIAGIVLMYFGKTETAYVSTGAGILSEFIAAVLFYLYNKTITEMGQYHHKLVLTQNLSLALDINQNMKPEEEKTKAQHYIIEQLLKDINQHLVIKPTAAGVKAK